MQNRINYSLNKLNGGLLTNWWEKQGVFFLNSGLYSLSLNQEKWLDIEKVENASSCEQLDCICCNLGVSKIFPVDIDWGPQDSML